MSLLVSEAISYPRALVTLVQRKTKLDRGGQGRDREGQGGTRVTRALGTDGTWGNRIEISGFAFIGTVEQSRKSSSNTSCGARVKKSQHGVMVLIIYRYVRSLGHVIAKLSA